MKRGIKIATALLEPILVFVGGALLSKLPFKSVAAGNPLSQWMPLCRVVTIITIAFIIEKLLRKRDFREWGLWGEKFTSQTFTDALFLLITGGLVPLALTWMYPSVLASDVELQVTGVLVPIISQEIFLMGYARLRFADALQPRIVTALIVVLFLAAHFNHTANEPVGLLFLLAMGWQGFIWSCFIRQTHSLAPLMMAHLALLVLYKVPAIGFATLCIGLVLNPYREWLTGVLKTSTRDGS